MLLSQREISVLSAFFPEAEPRTALEIQNRCGYSHERVHSTLKALEEEGIITSKAVGKSLLYSLHNFGAAYIASAQLALARKAKFSDKYPQLVPILDEFFKKTRSDLLIIFGSYSRMQPLKDSDLDILCVNPKGNAERGAAEISHRYGFKLAPVSVSLEEFPKIKQDNPELWKSLKHEGIIWKGHEWFYDQMYG